MRPRQIFRRKAFVVDEQQYEASLTAVYEEFVQLRLTVRAAFGHRSFCTIRGLQNYDYYFNYGHWDETHTIAITPKVIAALIRFDRQSGWTPETSKANVELQFTNAEAESLVKEEGATG